MELESTAVAEESFMRERAGEQVLKAYVRDWWYLLSGIWGSSGMYGVAEVLSTHSAG